MSGLNESYINATLAEMTQLEADVATMQADYNEALDTIWMLLAAMLVFFMHAGFSMLEAGCVRFKNTQNILAKNLVVVTVGFLCWYILGYPLALGAPNSPNKFAGGANAAMDGFWDSKESFRVWFFQGAFCATGGTIVSGAMAERTQLKGFAIFIILMTSIIYPCIVWWGWSGNGFLWYQEDGMDVSITGPAFSDFAGSGIVHLAGGVGAFVGALVVGPRCGRWIEEDFNAHSIPFCVLGTFFLWFGWYGFNPGSTASMKTADDAYLASMVAVNTTLAPCIAGLVVFGLRAHVVAPKCLDVGGFCNGILAGLVSITAGCSTVKSWEALLIGAIGGFVYQGTSMLMQRMGIDDVVDAVAVHGACGLWGIIALGFFGHPDTGGNGLFYGGDQLRTQLFAGFIIIVWVGGLSLLIFLPLRVMGMLRLPEDFQAKGADVVEHSPPKAYNQDVRHWPDTTAAAARTAE